MPHILLLWTMAVSSITGTEHGDWRYLGTYSDETACLQAIVVLGNRERSIYGKFVCQPQETPKETESNPPIRFLGIQ